LVIEDKNYTINGKYDKIVCKNTLFSVKIQFFHIKK